MGVRGFSVLSVYECICFNIIDRIVLSLLAHHFCVGEQTFEPSFVLTAALPAVEACLRSVDDVWAREAGMLALGALSKGCLDQLAPYLPQLYPCFLQVPDVQHFRINHYFESHILK